MTTNLIVRNVPPRLKGKIYRRAEREKSSFNDVAVAALCEHFSIPFEPSGYRTPRAADGEDVTTKRLNPNPVLRVPVELKRRIDVEAATRGETQTNVAREILSEAFGVPFVPTGRWIDRATA